MSTQLRADLLRLVCAELPEPDASFIRSLPADDVLTHIEAYVALRRLDVDLPGELHHQFVLSLVTHLDCGMSQDHVQDHVQDHAQDRPRAPQLVEHIEAVAEYVVAASCGHASVSFTPRAQLTIGNRVLRTGAPSTP